MEEISRFRGCLLGLAVADAVGTTVEFQPRGSFAPLTDMVGRGPFNLRPGQWTDDTSMALCLATSLVILGQFNPQDQMERYCRWQEEGYWSSTGTCFDIGNTVRQALATYRATGNPLSGPTDPRSAGNGCLMRLAPVPLFYFPDRKQALHFSEESSLTTHGALECREACRLFGGMIFDALAGKSKQEILSPSDLAGITTASIQAIGRGEYRYKAIDEIRGTGYVVASLEAALWCFWGTESYAAAVLQAANLGDDADTTAAICGQLAGAYYGEAAIPLSWREQLTMADEIGHLAEQLYRAAP